MHIGQIIIYTLCFLLASCGTISKQSANSTNNMDSTILTLLIGTYTSGDSEGIYTFHFDESNGTLSPLRSVTPISNPSFMALSENSKHIYAVSEDDESNSAVTAFALDSKTGVLRVLNTEKVRSASPCYILNGGGWVATANYDGGTVSTFALDKNGKLKPLRQEISFSKENKPKSHLHCIQLSPDKKYAFACDLGKDSIYRFKVNSKDGIINNEAILLPLEPAISVKQGSGPRHLTFAPNGEYAYLINELSGTVVAFRYNGGELTEIQTIVADSAGGRGSADIHVSPDGRFLYASNRVKEDGIAIFQIAPADGTLKKIGYCNTGIHPRNFRISPNGKYMLVACRDSNAVQIYERDILSGLLTNTGHEIKLDHPVYVQLVR